MSGGSQTTPTILSCNLQKKTLVESFTGQQQDNCINSAGSRPDLAPGAQGRLFHTLVPASQLKAGRRNVLTIEGVVFLLPPAS